MEKAFSTANVELFGLYPIHNFGEMTIIVPIDWQAISALQSLLYK